MTEIMFEAACHDGTSVAEKFFRIALSSTMVLMMNWLMKATREDRIITLQAGERMIFGKDKNKGLR